MKKLISLISIAAIWCGLCTCCAYSQSDNAYNDLVVRVAILNDVNHMRLFIKYPYQIFPVGSSEAILEGSRIDTKIISVKDGLLICDKVYKISGIRVVTESDSRLCVNKKMYRGDLDIIKKENSRLLVVNYVNLEEYLYGVLYHEVSHRWPMEALKTQAIAARTFAVYQVSNSKLRPYDLRSDIYSQVYGGSGFEKWSTNKAVDVTRGQIMIYDGEILPAYYHATCAGHTEDASNLWNVDIPALDGVRCDDCRHSPYFDWTLEMPVWELEQLLRKKGYVIDKISDTDVISRNRSGRVSKIEIKDSQGVSVILTGKDIRQLIGPNKLRSTNFNVSIKWGNLIFKGHGWGHGVGMCQWGAFGKAKAGMKADEILQSYYPGIEITTIDKLKLK